MVALLILTLGRAVSSSRYEGLEGALHDLSAQAVSCDLTLPLLYFCNFSAILTEFNYKPSVVREKVTM